MSYGQSLMKQYIDIMCPLRYIENYRPDWLFGMELDFYFPKKKIAIEFNGDQHYVPTDFGDPYGQIKRDRLKYKICKERGIWFRVFDASDLDYKRLRGRCKQIFGKDAMKNPDKLHQLSLLNKECISYRKTLISNWDSPTAHRNYSKIRQKIIKEKTLTLHS